MQEGWGHLTYVLVAFRIQALESRCSLQKGFPGQVGRVTGNQHLGPEFRASTDLGETGEGVSELKGEPRFNWEEATRLLWEVQKVNLGWISRTYALPEPNGTGHRVSTRHRGVL